MKDLFRGSYSEAINLKNLIENNNIEVFVTDEIMANLQPWTVTAGGFNPLVLRVSDENYEKAIAIVTAFIDGSLSQ